MSGCAFGGGNAAVNTGPKALDYNTMKQQLQLYQTLDTTAPCNPAYSSATEAEQPQEYLAKQLCQALKHQPPAPQTITTAGEILKNDETIQKAVAACNKKFQNPKTGSAPKDTEKLINYIEQSYGKSAAEFNNKFKSKITEQKVPVLRNNKVSLESISSIIESSEVYDATSRLEAERSKRESKTTQKNLATVASTSDAKEEGLTEEKDESKCTADKDCEYKDGKCKLKEEVKAKNDGKTTNTTGSNSFVINKAPLLLAFLLDFINL
uniref:Variant surface glycoprotein 1125.5672 n=1 Tax=Trypanosoma brucei TaxID=5691 RepID=A0A1J0RD56_9TRYP|nr:variant surface glycoprotein 1125.5672 [Trypanosoma brucei]